MDRLPSISRRMVLRHTWVIGLGLGLDPRGLARTSAGGVSATPAGSVRRCIDAKGRTSYTDRSCDNSHGALSERVVQVEDARTDDQMRQAQRVADREAAFARRARAERWAAEQRAAHLGPAGVGHRGEVDTSVDTPERRRPTRIKVRRRRRAKLAH